MNSFQIYDSTTKTFTINSEYEFEDGNKKTALHVIIGDNITEIPEDAFIQCYDLISAYIGDSVTTINTFAFSNCESLASVYIGKSVTTIYGGSFAYCEELKCIFFNGENEPTFPSISWFSKAFDEVPSTTVMVPASYSGSKFEEFEVIRDTTIEGCENIDWGLSNIKTETFTQSNTLTKSNTFTKSNLFTQSNTFTPSNAFSQSNTYTKSNTFIPSNTFTNSNTYTKSNIFSQSSTFTESNTFFYLNTFIKPINSNSNFTISFLLTYSLTFTHTISYELIVTNSFTISLFESKYRGGKSLCASFFYVMKLFNKKLKYIIK